MIPKRLHVAQSKIIRQAVNRLLDSFLAAPRTFFFAAIGFGYIISTMVEIFYELTGY